MTTRTITESDVFSLNQLCIIVNDWATSKGWNEGEDSVQRKSSDIALMHSELSECLEFVRKKIEPVCPSCGPGTTMQDYNGKLFTCLGCEEMVEPNLFAFDDHVPSISGEHAELADVLIRIFHYCGRRGINLGEAVRLKHEYNLSRPYKHGKTI